MISINKFLAIAVLVLTVACSDNNTSNPVSSNPVGEENSQVATQPSNPVTIEEQNTGNSQSNSSQPEPVTVNNSPTNLPQKQSVAANSGNTNNSQTSSPQYQPVPETNHLKPVNDTFIIPGKRIGLITGDTKRADLVELYGETNLKDDVVLRGEGTVSFPVTKVNSTTPGALTIFWTDESRSKISHVSGFGRQWKTLDSLGIGTSINGVKDVLGKFELNGFGWDNGGFVYLENTNLSKYKDKLGLRLNVEYSTIQKFPKPYQAVSGDSRFSSNNPNFKPLDVRVSNMIVTFDKNISPDMF
ncbi:hypothetical protein NIES267_26290 [Calothrix parasitica NIES-267]|uniref:Lipoprotein n=1 Tax=Calothrix parasitica NIES-267 TaxID=1973488 RepID=A0A1Z4LPF2_9CYAN|nr:hypothetical protein NIES267_26290 [Calothrix parasitica NIES-267]